MHGDYRPEKIGAKIREAQLEKIPYMLVVGDKEQAAGTVAVRTAARAIAASSRWPNSSTPSSAKSPSVR